MSSLPIEKDAPGQYLHVAPDSEAALTQLWGLSVVATTAMPQGSFLIGSNDPRIVHIRTRQGTTIEISTQHSDYFTRNMVAILCEARLALVVTRPSAFIKGALTSSPA